MCHLVHWLGKLIPWCTTCSGLFRTSLYAWENILTQMCYRNNKFPLHAVGVSVPFRLMTHNSFLLHTFATGRTDCNLLHNSAAVFDRRATCCWVAKLHDGSVQEVDHLSSSLVSNQILHSVWDLRSMKSHVVEMEVTVNFNMKATF